MRSPIPRGAHHVLLALVCLWALGDWLSASTTRLYQGPQDQQGSTTGAVEQQFRIRGGYVIPEIVTQGDVQFVVRVAASKSQQLLLEVVPTGAASLQVCRIARDLREPVTALQFDAPISRAIPVPPGTTELQFIGHGALVWRDLRVVRTAVRWPIWIAAIALLIASFFIARPAGGSRAKDWWTLAASTLACLFLAEAFLHLIGSKLPPAIAAARAEFGFSGGDGLLIDPARYKLRLRPGLNTSMQWQFGDIVRLGFLPRELSPGDLHRYPLRTDAEGFRNERSRARVEVAALGDSFTDGTSGPAAESWPARLEQASGLQVQNYGTSGFGPQQELYVLEDYVRGRHPRWVVLAFCAGNDLRDAEVFDAWERAGRPPDEPLGWELRRSYRRYETLYLWTASRVAWDALIPLRESGKAKNIGASAAAFDRGLFTIPGANGNLHFALLPHYVRNLVSPRAEIEQSRGWQLTKAALQRMQNDCASSGSELVLMFVPEKTQVYWPLITRNLAAPEMARAIEFYSRAESTPLNAADMDANRLALNQLLRDFCAQESIPMLDLTEPLAAAVAAGRATYFVDDTHWNAAGHELAARELAAFLAAPR